MVYLEKNLKYIGVPPYLSLFSIIVVIKQYIFRLPTHRVLNSFDSFDLRIQSLLLLTLS